MLHILWMIIKFILILLGIILGLILLAVLLVLFCPFRYYAAAEKLEDDFKKTKLYVSASWLFHGVWIRLQFQESKLDTKINLIGIPVHRIIEFVKNKRSEKNIEDNNRESEDAKNKEVLEDAQEEKPREKLLEEKVPEEEVLEDETKETSSEDEALEDESEETSSEEEVWEDEALGDEPEETSSEEEILEDELEETSSKEEGTASSEEEEVDKTVTFLEKIRNILDSVSGKLKNIGQSGSPADKLAEKIRGVREKIQGILDKINWWKGFLTDTKVKAAVNCVKKALFKIIKHVIPTRLYGNLTIGSDDPAKTGTVLAIMGITMPFHKNCIEITPLFNGENVLKGKVQIKGRIYVFVLLFQVLKVIVNKNVRYTMKYWKNKEES